ncbi:hypothetical protein D3C71_1663980 [compost metagenome]
MHQRAIGKRKAASFARAGGVVRCPGVDRIEVFSQPCRRPHHGNATKQLQRLPTVQATLAGLQGLQSQPGARDGTQVEVLMQVNHPLPGLFVFVVGSAPLPALLLQGRVMPALAQLQHPLDGLLDRCCARLCGGHHVSTRRCSAAGSNGRARRRCSAPRYVRRSPSGRRWPGASAPRIGPAGMRGVLWA